MRVLLISTSALVLANCVTLDKTKGHDRVDSLMQERLGVGTGWEKGTPEAEQIAERVRALLQGGLTRQNAVEIALLNNPGLQATYEELGVSQADLIQAGLLSNPSFSLNIGFPLTSEGSLEREFSLVQEFVSLFMLPLRRSVAEEQFVTDTLRVAHEALGVAAEVQKELVALQTQESLLEVRRATLQASEAAADLSRRQFEAGNITALELALMRASYERTRVDASRTELSIATAREHLNRLLGLWGPQTAWKVKEPLAAVPDEEPSLERLESRAIGQRLDVIAARQQAALMARAAELARTWRWFGSVQVGADFHDDPDGPRLLGPTLELELPLFDQRQAEIARIEAQQRQAERRLAEASVNARSEVREHRARLLAARDLALHFKNVVLPLHDQVMAQSLLQYNGMQIGLYQLLEAKQEQLDVYRDYVEALESYWAARADLERSLGGRLPTASAKPGAAP